LMVFDQRAVAAERELPQPGGRAPAPGELAVVQSFLNSYFDVERDWGADLLATPEALHAWFARRGMLSSSARGLTARDVGRAIAVREGFRALVVANVGADESLPEEPVAALNAAVGGALLRVHLGIDGLILDPAGRRPLDRALGALLATAVRAMLDGGWQRLKACPGDHCGWAFYDYSRNNSGRWCSMAVCGGRAKARNHYRRRRAPA
jgi:predicted RNA-binding Zn ribbon-like protein